MEFAAEVFMSEDGFEMQDQFENHIKDGGWYSSEVLATALRSKALQAYGRLRWQLVLRPAGDYEDVLTAAGAVQNRSSAHWVAFRTVSDIVYEFDSLQSCAKAHSPASLLPLLRQHPTYCIHNI